jgi:ribonucleoside-diphosphate reductase beta chain
MKYPEFFDMYRDAVRNTWTVDEVDFSIDVNDLRDKLLPAERHMVNRLVAFFATGDSIVSNNLVLSLYTHINAPEARMYLSRQLYEEALHVQFYLTLLDTYIPDIDERELAFAAIHNIPSIKAKADFCFKYMDGMAELTSLQTDEDRQKFLLNLACFSACIEGLFFFAAFAYVYFLRNRGLLPGLASGTNWVFRDESMHMQFSTKVFSQVKEEYPGLVTKEFESKIRNMISDAVDCEMQFAEDVLGAGVPGMSLKDMRTYLEFVGDRRLEMLGLAPLWGSRNPFDFMELQGIQELTNFFERRVSAYQIGVSGEVSLDEEF